MRAVRALAVPRAARFVIQDPVRVSWEPIVKVEHYQANAARILAAAIDV